MTWTIYNEDIPYNSDIEYNGQDMSPVAAATPTEDIDAVAWTRAQRDRMFLIRKKRLEEEQRRDANPVERDPEPVAKAEKPSAPAPMVADLLRLVTLSARPMVEAKLERADSAPVSFARPLPIPPEPSKIVIAAKPKPIPAQDAWTLSEEEWQAIVALIELEEVY